MYPRKFHGLAQLITASIGLGTMVPIAHADSPLKVQVTNTVPVTGAVTVGGTVSVTNTPSAPLATLEAKNPLQLRYSGVLNTRPAFQYVNGDPVVATVPAGQMWVIEHISVTFGATYAVGDNATAAVGTPQIYDVIPLSQQRWPDSYEYAASIPTKIYAMPGETVNLYVEVCCSDQNGIEGVSGALTGYWVPTK